jgi:hypothetical protein
VKERITGVSDGTACGEGVRWRRNQDFVNVWGVRSDRTGVVVVTTVTLSDLIKTRVTGRL